MKIKRAGNGIYVTVVQSALVIADITLDYKSDPGNGSVRYSPSAYTAGQMPPYLEYTPSDGKFHYHKVHITGHRDSETYDISGQL